jgi:hypothetical protein
MKVALVVMAAAVVGVAAGLGTAWLRTALLPWDGNPAGSDLDPRMAPLARAGQSAPKAVVEQLEFDFGTMDFKATGRHDFVIRNVGQAPLILAAGDTSCRCTLSSIQNDHIPPGQSTKVTLTWTGDETVGPYRETATIFTNDPAALRVSLTVSGRLTAAVRAIPQELVFSTLSANQAADAEVRLLCYLPQPLEILGCQLSDQDSADYFGVTFEPLAAEQLREDKDARSGVLMRVAVKPGLPQGPFRQTILVRTTLKSVPTFDVPIQGMVGSDISIVGRGWDAESGVLTLGTVSSQVGAKGLLILIARGPYRKQVSFKPIPSESDQLKVTVGETTEINNGAVTQTPLIVEIPKGSRQANHYGSDQGKFGQIIVETTHPQVPKLRILVRYAVVE